MAKQSLLINKFEGGLNTYSDPRDLQENEFQILDNACVDEIGIIRTSGRFDSRDSYHSNLSFDEFISDNALMDEYESIPVAGKGLYSFKFDNDVSDVFIGNQINNGFETGSIETSGSGWKFQQSYTLDTSGNPTNNYLPNNYLYNSTSLNSIIDYVNMSANVTGADTTTGIYDMGYLEKSVTLKRGATYQAFIKVVADRPWNLISGCTPPKIRIYNPTDNAYLDYEGVY